MIKFYRINDSYGEFSNFSPYNIILRGTTWNTSEHYFQARKFKDVDLIFKVMDAPTPMEAARIGRDRNNKIREEWESIKLDIMKEAVYAKFTQHRNLKDLLLSTGNEELVEASPYDSFWGEGEDGKGLNHLGKILMEVREQIRQEPPIEVILPWEFNAEAEPYDFFWSQGEAESIIVNWSRHVKSLSDEEKEQYFNEIQIPDNWR